MKSVTTKAIAKIAAVATGLAFVAAGSAFALSAQAAGLTTAQVQDILNLLSGFGANASTIANVQAALTGQPSTTTTTTTPTAPASSYTFTRDLTVGSTGADVTALQQALISGGYLNATATGYFGSLTQAAVAKWQTAMGISPAAGYFGAKSRAAFAAAGPSSTTTTTTTTPVTGNGLKVSLSPTSPSNTVLVQGQGIGDLADYVFANPSSAPITVTGLTFNRIGVSNDQTINNVYLYNGVSRLTDSAGVSNSSFSFTNAAGLFVVQPGQTFTVSVRADIATGTAGQQLGAALVSVASSGTLDSSDTFPINSGYQTISAANLAVVQFSPSSQTLPQGTNVQIAPQTNYTLWQNSVSVSTNPVWLKSMTFTNLGSISSTNIGNFRLYVDGNQVGTAVATFDANRHVVFDLSAAPVSLSTQSHIIKVLADVTGGSSLTFQLSVQRSSDALFIDSQLNQPVTPTVSGSTNFSAVSPVSVTVQSVSATSGVSVSKDPNSQAQSISVGATSVDWGTFDVLASGESVKVSDLFVCADDSVSSGGLKNGKVYFNGVQVGSTKDLTQCSSHGVTNSTAYTDYSLGSSMILPAGTTAKINIYGDAKTSTSTNLTTADSVTIHLVAQGSSGSNGQGQNSLNSTGVPSGAADVTSNGVTLTASTLTASKFTGYANQTIIPGATNALLGEFSLGAGSAEGINVNTIGIDASSSALTYLQNLTLKNMATGATIGTVVATPSQSNSFSLGSNLLIPASGTVTIGVYGNVLSNAGTATYSPLLAVDAVGTSGTGAVTGISASVGTAAAQNVMLQNISTGSGTLVAARGASSPAAANVVAGASALQVGDFSFSANNSSYTIQKMEIDASSTAAAAINSITLQYTDVNGVQQKAVATGPTAVSGSNTLYEFTGLTMYVPANGSADVTAWVSTPTISSGGSGISGLPIVLALSPNNFQAQDQSGALNVNAGNNVIAANSVMSNGTTGYGTIVVRKTVVTFAGQSQAVSSQPIAGNTLYQFTVSADPAGSADLEKLSFNIATSNLTVTGFQLYDAANPSTPLNAVAVNAGGTYATAVTSVAIIPDQVIQIPAGGSKTFILKATSTGTWTTGSSLQINLAAADTTLPNNGAGQTLAQSTSYNYVWSDRSLNTDATTGSNEWTDGYLLRDLVDGTYSFTHS